MRGFMAWILDAWRPRFTISGGVFTILGRLDSRFQSFERWIHPPRGLGSQLLALDSRIAEKQSVYGFGRWIHPPRAVAARHPLERHDGPALR